ncbi:MAG: hypothetical protein RIS52_179 [Pseudomonadota bacterium]
MKRAGRALKFSIAGVAVILLGALVTGLFMPLEVTGVMITALGALGAVALGVILSREPIVSQDMLVKADIKTLPHTTSLWLDAQRKALPAPAQALADSIGVKLECLAPQLQALDEREPAATEIRRLIADELPELVAGYQRVPENLRRDGLNGLSPDKQLVEGLAVVDSELKRMSEQLASGDLNKLATQGRYLEIKYQGDAS